MDRSHGCGLLHQRWEEDSQDEACDESETLREAVEEAQLQASFAQQTAKEMEQVVNWWKTDESMDRSQSRCLKDNSLVYASPHSRDEEEMDFTADDCFMTPSLFQSPLFSSGALSGNNEFSIQDATSLAALLSPIAPADSPHQEAQEQSFAVDAVCSAVKRMEDELADLEDTSVDDEASTKGPLWVSLEDLPWRDQQIVYLRCCVRWFALQLEQWLYHVLPPVLLSFWLSPHYQPVLRLILWVLLPSISSIILYHLLWNAQTSNAMACSSFVHLDDDLDEDFPCEFIQQVLL